MKKKLFKQSTATVALMALLFILTLTGLYGMGRESEEVEAIPQEIASTETYDLDPQAEAGSAANPNFTIQTYFNFPKILTSELTPNEEEARYEPHNPQPETNPFFIDTRNADFQSYEQDGNVSSYGQGGNLPTNSTRKSLNYLEATKLEEITPNTLTDETFEKDYLTTQLELVPLFMNEETTYQENPQIENMSRLYNAYEEGEYNPNYTLIQVWIYNPPEEDTELNDIPIGEWIVYNVPEQPQPEETIGVNAHDPSQIRFTNNPDNPNITVTEANYDQTVNQNQENPYVSINGTSPYQDIVKATAGTDPDNAAYPYKYTILIKNNTQVRLVYQYTWEEDVKEPADFFDYDFSTGSFFLPTEGDTLVENYTQGFGNNPAVQNGYNMWYPTNNVIFTTDQITGDLIGKIKEEFAPTFVTPSTPISANFFRWGINNYNVERKFYDPHNNFQPSPPIDSVSGTDFEDFSGQKPYGLSFGNQYFGKDQALNNAVLDNVYTSRYDPLWFSEEDGADSTQLGQGTGCFGLVTGVQFEQGSGLLIPIFNGNISTSFDTTNYSQLPVQNLFGASPILKGKQFGYSKTIYSENSYANDLQTQGVYYNLDFYRQGGTYTLSSVSANQKEQAVEPEDPEDTEDIETIDDVEDEDIQNPELGGIEGLRALGNWNSSNDFWPLDNDITWGTPGHDPRYGGSTTGDWGSTYFTTYPGGGLNNSTDSNYGELIQPNNFTQVGNGEAHNGAFGMSYSVDFELEPGYIAPLEYWFYGDDDMWVFLVPTIRTGEDENGDPIYKPLPNEAQLIADNGGIHAAIGTYVNLWDWIIPVGYESANNITAKETDKTVTSPTNSYRMLVFYNERGGGGGSCCYMRFTLPLTSNLAKADPLQNTLMFEKELINSENEEVPYNNSWTPQNNSENLFSFQLNISANDITDYDSYAYQLYNSETNLPIGTLRYLSPTSIGNQYSYNFDLWAGTYIVFQGIPSGIDYTITETSTGDFETFIDPGLYTDGGFLSSKKQFNTNTYSPPAGTDYNAVVFTNTYSQEVPPTPDEPPAPTPTPTPTPTPGNLVVQKQVMGNISSSQPFNFTVNFTNSNGNPLTGNVTYKYSNSTTSNTAQLGTNGSMNFTLTPNQYVTFTGLPNGTKYSVSETKNSGYTVNWANNTGTITNTTGATALAVNALDANTGSLQVTKQAPNTDANTSFNFNVTFTSSAGTPVTGPISYTKTGTPGAGSLRLTNGTGSFTLSPGQSIFFTDLAYGTRYTVSEDTPANYTVSWRGNTGTISATNSTATATATNTPTGTSVVIEKFQSLNGSTPTKDQLIYSIGDTITYTINVTNNTGSVMNNVTVTDQVAPEINLSSNSISPTANFDSSSRTLSWSLGQLNPGQSVTVSFSGVLSATPVRNTVNNTAYISANGVNTPSNTVVANPNPFTASTVTTVGRSPKTGVGGSSGFGTALVLLVLAAGTIYGIKANRTKTQKK